MYRANTGDELEVRWAAANCKDTGSGRTSPTQENARHKRHKSAKLQTKKNDKVPYHACYPHLTPTKRLEPGASGDNFPTKSRSDRPNEAPQNAPSRAFQT